MTSSEIGVDAYNRLVAKSLCRIKQSKQLPIFIVVCSTTRMLGLFAVLHACMHACMHTYIVGCCHAAYSIVKLHSASRKFRSILYAWMCPCC